jgi:asparagine synthase (glutamine-hydrolysing)
MDDFSDLLSFPQKGELLVADTAWILTRKIAKEAQRLGIKVLLSGAGADEWFAGYRRHWFFYQWLKYSKLFPEKLKKVALSKLRIGKLRWIEMPEGGSISDVWDAAVSSKFAGVLKQKIRISLPTLFEPDSDLDRALAWDQRNYLCQDVLAITDLATMEYGIEGRFPFLHPALCNFAGSMSAKDRIHHGRKWLLKQKVEAWAGKEFTKRKKQGFGLPLDLFFKSDTGKEWVSRSREILVARLPELFKDKEWFDFQKEADIHPGNFSQENLALCWLADWLKTND